MTVVQWQDIPEEQMNPLVSRRTWHGQQMTMALVKLNKGALVPQHHHHHEQTTMLQSGHLIFRTGEQEHHLRAGDMLRIAPNLPHAVEALEDSVAVDIFAPVRDDWQRGEDAYLRGN
jgi:quercetin dioxygenase-like cupin family protein